jgi:hypothetical protein
MAAADPMRWFTGCTRVECLEVAKHAVRVIVHILCRDCLIDAAQQLRLAAALPSASNPRAKNDSTGRDQMQSAPVLAHSGAMTKRTSMCLRSACGKAPHNNSRTHLCCHCLGVAQQQTSYARAAALQTSTSAEGDESMVYAQAQRTLGACIAER